MGPQILAIAYAAALGCLSTAGLLAAENGAIAPVVRAAVPPVISTSSESRMLGVVPTYLVVDESNSPASPLTAKQKFQLFLRETTDPSTFAAAGIAAALSQSGNEAPRYGVGAGPYGQRLGAAYADVALCNFFSDAVLASVFHQDPRYYRMGPPTPSPAAPSIPFRVSSSPGRIAAAPPSTSPVCSAPAWRWAFRTLTIPTPA